MSMIIDAIARRLGYSKASTQAASRVEPESRYYATILPMGAQTIRRPEDTKTNIAAATQHPMAFASINHVCTAAMGVPLKVMRLKPDAQSKATGRLISKSTSSHVQRQWCKRSAEDRAEWVQTKGLVAEDVADDHPLRELLDQVNPYSTWSYLVYEAHFDLLAAGNSYWELVGGKGFKQPTQLYRMNPEQIEVVPSERGIAGYKLRANGREVPFEPEEVLHLRLPSPLSPYYGMSRMVPLSINLATEGQRMDYGKEFMQNKGQLAGLLVARDGAVPDKDHGQAILEDFRKKYTGAKNAGVVAMLNGVDYVELGHTPQDAEYIGMADRHDIEIGAVIGTPGALFKSRDVNRSNLEGANSQFWNDTMVPLLTFVSDMINEFLCPRYGEDIVVEFDLSGVKALHESEDALVQRESTRHNDGITTIDEYREATGLDAWPDGHGQKIKRSPVHSYVRLDEEPESEPEVPPIEPEPEPEDPAPPAGDAPEKSETVQRETKAIEYGSEQHKALYKAWDDRVKPWEKRLEADVAQFARTLEEQVLARFEQGKSLKATIPDISVLFDVDEQGNLLWRIVHGVAKEAIAEEGTRTLLELVGDAITFNPDNPAVTGYLEEKTLKVKTVVADLHSQLKTAIADEVRQGSPIDVVTRAIRERFDGLADYQAKRIAQTEVVGAMNVANFSAIKEAGIDQQEWVATLDDRVRDSHVECMMQGPVPVGEQFVNGLRYPGDPGGEPAEVINCRCTIIAAKGEG